MTSTPARGPVNLFMLVLLAPIAATRQAHGHGLDAGARPFSPFAPMPCPRSAVPPPKFCAYVLWVGAACSNRCAATRQGLDAGARPFSLFVAVPRPRSAVPPPKFCATSYEWVPPAPIAATRQAHGHGLDAGARPFSPFAPMPRPRSAVPPPKCCAYVLWVGAACSNRCAAAHQAHDHGLDASATTVRVVRDVVS
ncbi:hypothetical protein PF008_g18325 [Phytophthora fragariae]|uniref:C2H2-type domain-containing protein n=1 Tax=Phytophthora fragariae TaxID=53985 RepID=A0A6G0R5Y8_9STRA|nr:hypothetical protein PF008_g18325 [Phytophthora fragariae]